MSKLDTILMKHYLLLVNSGETRMHSSRMRTACSLIVSPYLIISHACPPPPPQEQPCMPPRSNHACPPGSNHAAPPPLPRQQPHMPPQQQPCMLPRATTHAPPPLCGQTDTCKIITFANFVCGR